MTLNLQKFGNEIVLEAPGKVITANANGATSIEAVNKGTLRAELTVTAASGTTPSLTVTVQTSADNGVTDTWRDVAAFTAKTAAGSERKVFAGIDRYVRVKYAVSGTTPSFTVGVTGELV